MLRYTVWEEAGPQGSAGHARQDNVLTHLNSKSSGGSGPHADECLCAGAGDDGQLGEMGLELSPEGLVGYNGQKEKCGITFGGGAGRRVGSVLTPKAQRGKQEEPGLRKILKETLMETRG